MTNGLRPDHKDSPALTQLQPRLALFYLLAFVRQNILKEISPHFAVYRPRAAKISNAKKQTELIVALANHRNAAELRVALTRRANKFFVENSNDCCVDDEAEDELDDHEENCFGAFLGWVPSAVAKII